MELLYHLKISAPKTTWGIFVFFKAKDVIYNDTCNNTIEMTDKIYLRNNAGINLTQEELDYVKQATVRMMGEINRYINEKTVIEITGFEIAYTDYQPEGIYWAMVGWLSQRYGIQMPIIDFFYDNEKKKYIFKNIE
jgi:hypothetical protein